MQWSGQLHATEDQSDAMAGLDIYCPDSRVPYVTHNVI